MRYRVLDLPSIGAGAFTPTMATPPMASSWGLVITKGAPGTLAIPAPNPGVVPISQDPATQDSNNVPDFRTPDIYLASARNMGPSVAMGLGMTTRRVTPLPVPALSWISAAAKAMRGRKVGGRLAASMPRAFQRYGSLSGGTRSAS